MAGHSHWAQIKRQKGAQDAKRGAVFTKAAREIQIAVRKGGPNPDANFALRIAIDRARDVNMPKDSIERAIERAGGAGGADSIEEVLYEGIGPHGVALLCEVATDNRNRTVSELRHLLGKRGGQLGASGSVAWQFDQKGVILVETNGQDPDEISLVAIDLGADDVQPVDEGLEVLTAPENLQAVREGLLKEKLTVKSAELARLPKMTVNLNEADTLQILNLVEALEDLDDVQNVYHNLEISDEMYAKLEAS